MLNDTGLQRAYLLTGSQFPAETSQFMLFGSGQRTETFGNSRCMVRENFLDQGRPCFCEFNGKCPPVTAARSPFNKVSFGQVIDHQRDVAMAFEDFSGDLPLRKRSQMVESFKNGELAGSQIDDA